MKWRTNVLLLAVLSGACGLSAEIAEAGGGCYGYFGRPFSIYSTESIPYFAEFPPVYYSGPVARPYGYSPYAYPPNVLTPEPEPEPKITINPYVKPKPKAEVENTARRKRPQPLRIRNPFVTDDVQLTQAE